MIGEPIRSKLSGNLRKTLRNTLWGVLKDTLRDKRRDTLRDTFWGIPGRAFWGLFKGALNGWIWDQY